MGKLYILEAQPLPPQYTDAMKDGLERGHREIMEQFGHKVAVVRIKNGTLRCITEARELKNYDWLFQ